jgi:hypothetical protein
MKPRNPSEKKQIAYEKDHFNWAESAQAQRKTWPYMKAYSKRQERRKVRVRLDDIAGADEDTQGDFASRPVRRPHAHKFCGVGTLRETVDRRMFTRARRTAYGLFKHSYATDKHCERFSALLESITHSQTPYAQELAQLFDELLDPPADRRQRRFHSVHKQEWLEAFFHDRPDWEPRLRAWVEAMQASTED